MNKRQKTKVLSRYNKELESLNDCAKILSDTTAPAEFFSNYDLYMERLKSLSDAESSGIISVSGDSFCEKFEQMSSNNSDFINEFIDRVWDKTNGNEEEYLMAFTGYISKMPVDSIPHFLSRVTRQEADIEGLPEEFKKNSQYGEPERQHQGGLLWDEPIPVEEQIKGKEPDCDGLYPYEVLALSYAHCYYTDGNNEFPGFWWYKYGVRDVQSVLDSLLQRGYIKVGTIEDAVRAEKLTAIKEILKGYGLKTTGKKDALIYLLVSNVPEDELSQIFTRRTYACTNMGQELLKKYECIPYIHAHAIEDLNIWNIIQLVKGADNYRECILKYLEKKGTKYIYDRNYGLYRNTRFEMAELLWDEGKVEDAFSHLCEVCAFDLSGVYNGFSNTAQEKKIIVQTSFPYDVSPTTVAPGIIRRIKKCQIYLGWDKDILKEKLNCTINEIVTPFKIFSNEEIVNIILDEVDKDKDEVAKIYDAAARRFKK